MQALSKVFIILGIFLVIIGIIIWLFGDKISWFGNLPGDIKIVKENFSLYFPFTSMLIFSVILSLIIWIIRKLL